MHLAIEPGTGIETAIGAAVASAACVVARAMSDYRLHGALDPAIKLAGAERIAKVAGLQLDHGLGDVALAVIAREQGKLQLCRYFDADFYRHCRTADIETALDLAIDSVLEITAKVVRDGRTLRAAWTN